MTVVPPRFYLLLTILLAGHALAAPRQSDGDPGLVAASSGSHLWFIIPHPRDPTRADLCHHAIASSAAHGRTVLSLPRSPEALAAWGSHLWLIFPAPEIGSAGTREVYRLQILRDPVTGAYLPQPRDRLDVAAPLPGPGELIDFTGGPTGLLVLLDLDSQRSLGEGDAAASTRDESRGRLLRLQRTQWAEIELPLEVAIDERCRLAAAGENGELLHLLCPAADEDSAVLWLRYPDGRWSSAVVETGRGRLRDVIRMDTQAAAVFDAPDDQVRLAYLRPQRLIDLVTLERPDVPWAMHGVRNGFRLVLLAPPTEEGSRPRPMLRIIDPVHGRVGQAQRLTPQPLDVMGRLRLPILLAVIIVVAGLMLFLRPASPSALQVPEAWEIAGAGWRLGALLVDVLPSALLTMVVLRCSARDLLVLPLMTSDFLDWMPYMTVVLITMAHSAGAELATKRTLGKTFMNGRVVSVDGSTPGIAQILRRNLMKTLVLLAPPLAIVILLTPSHQGLQDLAAQTLVLRRRDKHEGV